MKVRPVCRAALLGLCLWAPDALAAGSWVAEPAAVRLAMAGREAASERLTPPPAVTEGEIVGLHWRYRLAPGRQVRARLCHPAGCVPLVGARGTSEALAGLSARTPLRLHFALAPGERQGLVVEGIQVIINYR